MIELERDIFGVVYLEDQVVPEDCKIGPVLRIRLKSPYKTPAQNSIVSMTSQAPQDVKLLRNVNKRPNAYVNLGTGSDGVYPFQRIQFYYIDAEPDYDLFA